MKKFAIPAVIAVVVSGIAAFIAVIVRKKKQA